LQVVVLFEARIERRPGVDRVSGGRGFCASARVIRHGRFDPDVRHSHFAHLPAADDAGDRDATGRRKVPGGVDVGKVAGHVHESVGGNVNGAVDVSCGDVGGSEERNGQGGNVHCVAAFDIEGHVRGLLAAPGRLPFDVVSDPVVDFYGAVVQFLRFGANVGGALVSPRPLAGEGPGERAHWMLARPVADFRFHRCIVQLFQFLDCFASEGFVPGRRFACPGYACYAGSYGSPFGFFGGIVNIV